jgi:Flp pilus assembly protein TadD
MTHFWDALVAYIKTKGIDFVKQNNYQAAIHAFTEALELLPNDPS